MREFLREEPASGVGILLATIAALIWANLGLGYEDLWHTEVGPYDLHAWINDALMAGGEGSEGWAIA